MKKTQQIQKSSSLLSEECVTCSELNPDSCLDCGVVDNSNIFNSLEEISKQLREKDSEKSSK